VSLWNLLILVTVASSFVLLAQRCLYAIAAVLSSGIAALLGFNLISINTQGSVPLMLATISGAVGLIGYIKSSDKLAVGAAAVLFAISGVQAITLLELL
jgi:hypothetical protein